MQMPPKFNKMRDCELSKRFGGQQNYLQLSLTFEIRVRAESKAAKRRSRGRDLPFVSADLSLCCECTTTERRANRLQAAVSVVGCGNVLHIHRNTLVV